MDERMPPLASTHKVSTIKKIYLAKKPGIILFARPVLQELVDAADNSGRQRREEVMPHTPARSLEAHGCAARDTYNFLPGVACSLQEKGNADRGCASCFGDC